MTGGDAPKLGTSEDARDALISEAEEVYALLLLGREITEEMKGRPGNPVTEEERERLRGEVCGLAFEVASTIEDIETLAFIVKTLEDIEALDNTPDERREDGP